MSRDLIKNCYRLPWTDTDNPNGWLEPTTFCQLKCPGCYRGLDKDDAPRIHESLSEMKRHVDRFIAERNVQTLSIAGGEPLLYPKLGELVSYIKSKRVRVKLFTNGVALCRTTLRRIKEYGVDECIIHVDKFQKRLGEVSTEEDMNRLREGYISLFRAVPGVGLGFIQPISRGSIADISAVMPLYAKHADIVSHVVFTLYTDIAWTKEVRAKIDTDITIGDVVEEIQKTHPFVPCAYLGSTSNPQEPSWLFSVSVGFKDEPLGHIDGALYRDLEERYHRKTGRFLFTRKAHTISLQKLMALSGYRSVRAILRQYAKAVLMRPSRLHEPLCFQTMLILRGPKFTTDGSRDLCAGCPDAMYYDGKLVPSCILEEIKQKHASAQSSSGTERQSGCAALG